MQKFNVYAVFDSKAGVHLSPFLASTDGVARRNFSDEINNPKSPFAMHPADYVLFKLASFDATAGTYDNLQRAENLGTGTSYVVEVVK